MRAFGDSGTVISRSPHLLIDRNQLPKHSKFIPYTIGLSIALQFIVNVMVQHNTTGVL